MTQEELGAALGVQKAAVQKIESGKTSVSVDKVKTLCEVFKVLPSALLFDSFRDFWRITFGAELPKKEYCMKDLEMISAITALAEDHYGPEGVKLLRTIDSLNEKGMRRAIAYVNDLTRIEEYKKGKRSS